MGRNLQRRLRGIHRTCTRLPCSTVLPVSSNSSRLHPHLQQSLLFLSRSRPNQPNLPNSLTRHQWQKNLQSYRQAHPNRFQRFQSKDALLTFVVVKRKIMRKRQTQPTCHTGPGRLRSMQPCSTRSLSGRRTFLAKFSR